MTPVLNCIAIFIFIVINKNYKRRFRPPREKKTPTEDRGIDRYNIRTYVDLSWPSKIGRAHV